MIWTLVEERQSLMEEVAMLKEQKQELVGVERDEGDDQVATVKETGEDEDTNQDADGLSVEEANSVRLLGLADGQIKRYSS